MLMFKDTGDHAGRASRLSLSVMAILAFCAVAAPAQTDQARTPPASEHETFSATSSATRVRRITPASAESGVSPVENSSGSGASEDAASPASPPGASSDVVQDPEEPPPLASNEAKSNPRIEGLRAQIKDAKDAQERARLRRTLIDYLVALDKKSDATSELRAAAQEERFDPAGFYNIGNALARLGDLDGAVGAYRKAIDQRRGHYSRALNNLGVVLLRRGQLKEAYEALASALKIENFRYAEASYNLGRLYQARGETELAMREWVRAINVQPDHTDAVLALARAYAQAGNPERGIAILDALKTRRGTTSEIEAARREIMAGAAAKSWKKVGARKAPAGAAPFAAGTNNFRQNAWLPPLATRIRKAF